MCIANNFIEFYYVDVWNISVIQYIQVVYLHIFFTFSHARMRMLICLFVCKLIYINLCIYFQSYDYVLHWKWNHQINNKHNEDLQSDIVILYITIRPRLIFPMECLCKIITSSHICLKTILKNNQTSGRSDPALLKMLEQKLVWRAWACLFYVFATFQHNGFSNSSI